MLYPDSQKFWSKRVHNALLTDGNIRISFQDAYDHPIELYAEVAVREMLGKQIFAARIANTVNEKEYKSTIIVDGAAAVLDWVLQTLSEILGGDDYYYYY